MIVRLLASLLIVAAAACAPASQSSSGRPAVVTAFYPLTWAASVIGGDDVVVTNLTGAGAEPHDLELTPGQVRSLREAALVVLVGGGFQPAVETAATGIPGPVVDVLELAAVKPALITGSSGEVDGAHGEGPGEQPAGHEEEGRIDPHVWLDPVLMAEIVRAVGNRLAEVDAAHADEHRSRAEALTARLAELDRTLASGLAGCARREFVTSHSAFAYLARRYGLTEVGISGLAPETEPSPQRLAEVATFAKERGVTTIFFETLVSPRVAES
ncbi:MAG: metal ABC transporter substrate-binding protein, partial [Gammaproteobacteria bacterium]